MKVEYITLGHTAREVVWIKGFINELKLEITKTIMLHSNNKMSIALSKNAKN